MDNVTGNCTGTKAGITVKTVFDGKQSGQQAFMKLIQSQYRISGAVMQNCRSLCPLIFSHDCHINNRINRGYHSAAKSRTKILQINRF